MREHGQAFFAAHRPCSTQRRIFNDLLSCRTAAKGGHVERCDECGHKNIAYNSCRNRHCPKCQGAAQQKWLADREEELLPVEYFHVIFSVPDEIARIALQNKKTVYAILFRAVWETLRQIANDPKHLGAEIGALAILHTWGQNLQHHPHIHCVIPGGGIAKGKSRWVQCRPGFFLPVKVLSRLFRGKFLHHMKEAFEKGKLVFSGEIEQLNDPTAFRSFLSPLFDKDWFVYCRPPFAGSAHVLRYLARYTHRVAISNHRLVDMKDGNVSFVWKDYANSCRRRTLTLTATEFLRRFLLHTLPSGFVRIRHFGFLANPFRVKKLALCRRLLADLGKTTENPQEDRTDNNSQDSRCSKCKQGTMITVFSFGPGHPVFAGPSRVPINDTS